MNTTPSCEQVVDLASDLLDDLDRVFGEALLFDADTPVERVRAVEGSTAAMRRKLSDSVDALRDAVVAYRQARRRAAPTREIPRPTTNLRGEQVPGFESRPTNVRVRRSTEARTIGMLHRFETLLPQSVSIDRETRAVFQAFAQATVELLERFEQTLHQPDIKDVPL